MRQNKSILNSTTALIGTALLFSASPALSRTNDTTLTSKVTLEADETYINNGNINVSENDGIEGNNVSAVSITNNGSINISYGGGIILRNGSSLSGGINNGSSGLINSSETGIAVNTSTVSGGINNSGSISGGSTAIKVNASTSGNITNSGNIISDSTAINIFNSSLVTSITNSSTGLISAGNTGIGVVNATISDGISNSGSISGKYGIYIDTSSVNGITNEEGGLLSSDFNSAAAIWIQGATISGSVTNNGSVINTNEGYGINIESSIIGEDIINDGLISAYHSGIVISHSEISGSITNNGTIKGDSSSLNIYHTSVEEIINSGILQNSTGIFLNYATISGGITNTGSILSSGNGIYGWSNASIAEIDNSGLISADVGISIKSSSSVSGGITNSGTISGGTHAIFLDSLSDEVNIIVSGNNARIIGDVYDDDYSNGHSIAQISGNFTTEGNWRVSDLTVDSGKTFTISNGDTVRLEEMSESAGTFRFAVNNAEDAGMITINSESAGINLTGASIAVHVVSGASLSDGDEILVGTGNVAVTGLADGKTSIADDSFFWDFTVGDGSNAESEDNTELYVFATEASLNFKNSGAANAIASLSDSDDEGVQEVIANLGSSSGEGTERILESLNPTSDGGSFVASQSIVSSINNLTKERIASLRNGTASSGIATGSAAQNNNAWGQVFGKTATQDMRDNISGYDADTAGVAFGLDTGINDNTNVGIALGMANTEVSSENLNTTNTDINSYQVSFYSDYRIDDRTFIDGNVGYVYGNNESTKHNVGGAGLVAIGEYDSQQVTAQARLGRNYKVGDSTVTLSTLAHYVNYRQDGYTETGNAGPLLLAVEKTDLQTFELGIGAEVSHDYKLSNGNILRPALRAGYRHEFLDENLASTATFTGGGTFSTDGLNPADDTLDAGASLKFINADSWDVSVDYGYEYKQDYTSHTGLMKVGYKF